MTTVCPKVTWRNPPIPISLMNMFLFPFSWKKTLNVFESISVMFKFYVGNMDLKWIFKYFEVDKEI